MKDHRDLKKKALIASAAVVLGGGVALSAAAYTSGREFTPWESDRKLNINQVHFTQDGDEKRQAENTSSDKSALWEEDEDAAKKERPSDAENVSYLFEGNTLNETEAQNLISIANDDVAADSNVNDTPSNTDRNTDEDSASTGTPSSPNEIYDIVEDKSDADTVIRRDDTSDDGSSPNHRTDDTAGGAGDGSGSGKNHDDDGLDGDQSDGSGGNSGRSDTDDGNHHGSDPSSPKDDGGDSDDGQDEKKEDSKKDDDQGSTTKPSRPNSSIKDPGATKPKPSILDYFQSDTYDEDRVTDEKSKNTIIIYGSYDDASSLYKGQEVDAYTVFCALDTYVYEGYVGKVYLWQEKDIGTYIKIDALSFDGGETWQESFPLTIPQEVEEGQMAIKVSYRLSTNDDWTELSVDYTPADSRLFVLSQQLGEDEDTVDPSLIINSEQYPVLGSKVNLFYYQSTLLGSEGEEISVLFPGWTEEGNPVSFFYDAAAGRHILMPADTVALDERYKVRMHYQWINEDYTIDINTQNRDSKYCPLQTLYSVDAGGLSQDEDGVVSSLQVPEYIQAVIIEEPLTVEELVIPSSVLYVDTDGSLFVKKSYVVDADNINYTSEEGILYNKAQTEIAGIPYDTEEITVDALISKVHLDMDNQIETITLEAKTMDDLPEIDFDRLKDCKIIVDDDILKEFLSKYGEKITQYGDCVAAVSDPDKTCTVKNHLVVSSDSELLSVLDSAGENILISDAIVTIKKDAFAEAPQTKILTLSRTEALTLEDGCFDGGNVSLILCASETQADEIQKQLDAQGLEDITVKLLEPTQDGYTYYVLEQDGETQYVLIGAPEDVEVFDGTIDNGRITVSRISDRAFENCSQLRWAVLPEETVQIGYDAFKGCTSLEGVMINTTDTITIGDRAFDGCSALRFVASNAANAVMADDYDPQILGDSDTDSAGYFFILSGAEGYGSNAKTVRGVSGIDHFELLDVGEDDKILYGVDEYGDPWVAIRSGAILPQTVSLPSTTETIYQYAFADAVSLTGSFELNWEELNPWIIHIGAFKNSDLGGHVMLGSEDFSMVVNIYDEAFAGCDRITQMDIYDMLFYIGQDVFTDCGSLQTVMFNEIASGTELNTGLFSGCGALEKIIFNDEVPPELMIYLYLGYQFDYDRSFEEEASLRLVVPEGSEETYLKTWLYLFMGFADSETTETVYLDVWSHVWSEMFDWDTFTFPTDEEVDAEVYNQILDTENHLRSMLGLELVSEPTDLYQYRVDGDELILVNVPSGMIHGDISPSTVGLKEGAFIDYIMTGTFSKCSQLEDVTIPYNLAGIYTNAFEGAASESDSLTLNFESSEPLGLLGGSADAPFEFGISDEKLHISVPEGSEAAYINAWVYPLLGYSDLTEVRMEAATSLMDEEVEVTAELVDQRTAEILLPVENRLRALLGMEQITDIGDMLCIYTVTDTDTTEESEESEETETPDESEETLETEVPEEIEESETFETIGETEESETSEIIGETEKTEETEETEMSEKPGETEESEASETTSETEKSETPEMTNEIKVSESSKETIETETIEVINAMNETNNTIGIYDLDNLGTFPSIVSKN